MKVCPKDKNIHLDNDNYCFSCGSKLVEEELPKCPSCHEDVSKWANFCRYCGHKLKKG